MTTRYTVTDFVVSDSNPSETPLNWCDKGNALEANRAFAAILDNIENTPPSDFPQFETRTTRIVIEVTRYV